MRRSLVLTAACIAASVQVAAAADMPIPAKALAPLYAPVVYNWTGFYVGGEGGGGWFTNQVTNGFTSTDGTVNFPPGFVHNPVHGSGGLGGGYAGYNYQVSQFVVGIDGDYTWAHLSGSTTDVGPTGFTNISHEKIKWIATATGRFGYAVNNWMIFGKAGWAGAGFNGISSTYNLVGTITNTDTNAQNRNGGTVGAGVEWGFAEHWSAKLEYDYVKFATAHYVNTAVAASGAVTFPNRIATSSLNIAKAGVSYRF